MNIGGTSTRRLVTAAAFVAVACGGAMLIPSASALASTPGSVHPSAAPKCAWVGHWVWDDKAKKWNWVNVWQCT
jgi:hypothetical protein